MEDMRGADLNAEGKTNTLMIRTPEGVVFSMLLAGPVTRSLAWAVDLACITAAMSIIGSVVSALGIVSMDFAGALSMVLYFLLSVGYGITTEWLWRGQTVGKRLLQLRVVDVQGLKLQFSQVVIRNLLRFLDSLPAFYLVGGTSCLLSSKSQRLGDIAANTVVIRTSEYADPDVDQVIAGKFNSLRGYPHLCARLRQQVSPAEAGVALQSLLRRNELDPEARISLFKEVADHFRQVVEFPEDATYGITDEQYIRNVVDILFRK
jgi:uncharacterized RDD family membrane protein YckC